ncbi:hypothetical protein [Paenibacillus tarimensis]|uniref:hypothetical protein n=1 Tax=Paenibacillus tarimensis TaxID=416012 RepID=UPI001F3B3CE6|nr:hypothetical protein [Paenibacillus tarimensis]MCF2946025.1 hypothetical protein [Paenibacillus tarimensis]
MFYIDPTGDGKEEAAVIIQTGRGTSLNNYDIHVVQIEDLSEIEVQSYEDIAAKEIESIVFLKDDGTLAVTVKVHGREYEFVHNFDSAPAYNQDGHGFGGVVVYSLENHK